MPFDILESASSFRRGSSLTYQWETWIAELLWGSSLQDSDINQLASSWVWHRLLSIRDFLLTNPSWVSDLRLSLSLTTTIIMELESLPSEIHLAIFRQLEHESLLDTSATSNYFRKLLISNKRIIVKALLRLDYDAVASDDPHGLRSHRPGACHRLFPCYSCLKILPDRHFKLQDCELSGPLTKRKSDAADSIWLRRCMTWSTPDELKSSRESLLTKSHLDIGRTTETRLGSWEEVWLYCDECEIVRRGPWTRFGNEGRNYRIGLCASCQTDKSNVCWVDGVAQIRWIFRKKRACEINTRGLVLGPC